MSLRNVAHPDPDPHRAGADRLAVAIRETSIVSSDRRFLFHHAAEYVERGWSVLPLNGKRPATPWMEPVEKPAVWPADLRTCEWTVRDSKLASAPSFRPWPMRFDP